MVESVGLHLIVPCYYSEKQGKKRGKVYPGKGLEQNVFKRGLR